MAYELQQLRSRSCQSMAKLRSYAAFSALKENATRDEWQTTISRKWSIDTEKEDNKTVNWFHRIIAQLAMTDFCTKQKSHKRWHRSRCTIWSTDFKISVERRSAEHSIIKQLCSISALKENATRDEWQTTIMRKWSIDTERSRQQNESIDFTDN
jgi:hypothetical protein